MSYAYKEKFSVKTQREGNNRCKTEQCVEDKIFQRYVHKEKIGEYKQFTSLDP